MLLRMWRNRRLQWAEDELEEAKTRLREAGLTLQKFDCPEEEVERRIQPHEERVRRAAAHLSHLRSQMSGHR